MTLDTGNNGLHHLFSNREGPAMPALL